MLFGCASSNSIKQYTLRTESPTTRSGAYSPKRSYSHAIRSTTPVDRKLLTTPQSAATCRCFLKNGRIVFCSLREVFVARSCSRAMTSALHWAKSKAIDSNTFIRLLLRVDGQGFEPRQSLRSCRDDVVVGD